MNAWPLVEELVAQVTEFMPPSEHVVGAAAARTLFLMTDANATEVQDLTRGLQVTNQHIQHASSNLLPIVCDTRQIICSSFFRRFLQKLLPNVVQARGYIVAHAGAVADVMIDVLIAAGQ
jgi:hypothetical protein